MQAESSQTSEQPQSTPLPNSAFIQDNVPPQQPMQQTTATTQENMHRKREVLALAKLKAAAERREVADQAKFEAAMAKLKDDESKLVEATKKRKEDTKQKKLSC